MNISAETALSRSANTSTLAARINISVIDFQKNFSETSSQKISSKNLSRIRPILLSTAMAFGGGLATIGINATESYAISSSQIVSEAWQFYNAQNYTAAISKLEQMFHDFPDWEAKAMEQAQKAAALNEYPANPAISDYWALYDLGTAKFILVVSNFKLGNIDQAIDHAVELIQPEKYRWAQTWDSRGWWWQPYIALKWDYPQIYQKALSKSLPFKVYIPMVISNAPSAAQDNLSATTQNIPDLRTAVINILNEQLAPEQAVLSESDFQVLRSTILNLIDRKLREKLNIAEIRPELLSAPSLLSMDELDPIVKESVQTVRERKHQALLRTIAETAVNQTRDNIPGSTSVSFTQVKGLLININFQQNTLVNMSI